MSLDNELLRQDQRTANAFTGSTYEDALEYMEGINYSAHTDVQSYRSNYEEERMKGVTVAEDGQYFNHDGEKVYYYTPPSELGAGGESEEKRAEFLTEAEIQEYWDADQGMGYFKEANPHIDFATHMEMVAEKQVLIENGTIDVNPYDSEEEVLLNHGFTARGPNADAINELIDQERDARRDAQATSLLEIGNEMNERYGINTTFKNGDGDTFVFNGSNYHKAHKVDDHLGPGDYARMAGMAVIGMAGAAIIGPAVQVGLGAAGTTTSAAGITTASGLSKGLTAALSNTLTQLASGNGVDIKSVVASGVLAGFNPGGKVLDAISIDGNTIVPDSALGGFVQGAVNNVVSSAITEGSVDLGGALLAGVGKGAMNMLVDVLGDTQDRSVEDRMRQVQYEHEQSFMDGTADPLYTPLSHEELYSRAMQMTGTGTTDLAGLIGKDGLITGIDEIETKWLNELMGGGQYDLAGVFIGPDGKEYTDTEILAMNLDPQAIGNASWNGQDVDGWTYAPTTWERTTFGKLVDGVATHVPGGEVISEAFNGFLDAAARQQFIDEYGFDPNEHPEAARQVFIFGQVDETYTFSDAPRGDSEVIGQVVGNEDEYSTGPTFKQENFPTKGNNVWSDADYAKVISHTQDMAAAGASETEIRSYLADNLPNGQATLPGSNTTILDAILEGVLAGAQAGGNSTSVTPETEVEGSVDNELIDDNGTVGPPTEVVPGEEPPPVLPTEEPPAGTPPPTEVVPGEEPPPVLPTTEPPASTPPPPATPPPPPAGTPTPTEVPPETPPQNPPELPGPIFGSAPVLPGGGGGGGGGGGMMSGGDYTPSWGELFAYTTLTPYQKRELEPMKDAIAEAKGMLA